MELKKEKKNPSEINASKGKRLNEKCTETEKTHAHRPDICKNKLTGQKMGILQRCIKSKNKNHDEKKKNKK